MFRRTLALLPTLLFIGACAVSSPPGEDSADASEEIEFCVADADCLLPDSCVCGECQVAMCVDDAECDGGSCVCGQCEPTDSECSDDDDCVNGRCDGGTCFTFECTPGTAQSEFCPDGTERSRLCLDGTWSDWPECPGDTEVTLELVVGELPASGASVLVTTPDNVLVAELVAGASGVVRWQPDGVGNVTVVFPQVADASPSIVTVQSVEPGDSIRLSGGAPTELDEVISTAQIALPGAFTDAADYDITMGCVGVTIFDSEAGATLDVRRGCLHDDGTFSVLATAFSEDRAALAHAVANGQVARPSGEVTQVQLSEWVATTPESTVAVELVAMPSGVREWTSLAGAVRSGRVYGVRVRQSGVGEPPPALEFPVAQEFESDSTRTTITLTYEPEGEPLERRAYYRGNEPAIGPVTADFSQLPTLLSGNIQSNSNGQIQLDWLGAGDPGDATLTRISWEVDGVVHYWRTLAPPGATDITHLTLPESLSSRRPPPLSQLQRATVFRYQCSNRVGWSDARVSGCPNLGQTGDWTPPYERYQSALDVWVE